MKKEYDKDELSPLLKQLQGRGDGYRKAPVSYFSELEDKVLQEARVETKMSSISVVKRSKIWLSYAAAAAIVAAASFTALRWVDEAEITPANLAVSDWEKELDQLADDEILDYIDANIEEFEFELLASEDVVQN